MAGTACAARSLTSSRLMPPSGWRMTTRGSSEIPKTPASVLASLTNGSEQMTAVGTPRRSSSIVSWTLHDVHEPQSPIAVMTQSASRASSSRTSSAAPNEAFGFCRQIASRVP